MEVKKHGRLLIFMLMLAWVVGILAPLHSFRRFSTSYRAAFDWAFHTHASHVLMHTFLYAVLGCLLCSLCFRPMRSPGRLLGFVLLCVAMVAGLQETIQMMCGHVALGGDEVFDVCVDLNGGLLGALLFTRIARPDIQSTDLIAPAGAGGGCRRC